MENIELLLGEHIKDLIKSKSSFDLISERWNLLSLFDKMSDFHIEMSDTRKEFESLTSNLLIALQEERLKKLASEMNSKAQVAVDIVIRNLFERTADIGFLSTDDDIREYLNFLLHADDNKQQKSILKKALHQRFKEYVAKYSVYDNIILFDTDGKVLLELTEGNSYSQSSASFINEALRTNEDYVEYYDKCDVSNDEKSLIYAFRVTEENRSSSKPIGVLALFFKFEDEMNKIFDNLIEKDDWSEIVLLDNNSKVIASSDKNHIPLGVSLDTTDKEEYKIIRYCGREYVAKTCNTKGYQGFYGLGWSGHTMIPLEHAFSSSGNELSKIDSNKLEIILQSATIFDEELTLIPKKAKQIQKELELTIWNGNVDITKREESNSSFARSMLHEISITGSKTNETFEESITNLNSTIMSSLLNDVSFLAKLSIDIMDRNLYERANDCRWWALTSFFRKSLNSDMPDKENISSILEYINDLYTVYTNLFIYDSKGEVIAVSNSKEQKLVGERLSYNWVNETLNLRNSQNYSVTPFEETPLYDGASTYIYGASITDRERGANVLGGIGVVFDSTPELYEMLKDTLPKRSDGSIKDNYLALYCDRNKKVISTTNQRFKIGETLLLDEKFFNLEIGSSYSDIVEYSGKFYAVGSSLSKGYREYKVHDNYSNDVYAIVLVDLGSSQRVDEKDFIPKPYSFRPAQKEVETVDYSTFYLNDKVYALESKYVIQGLRHEAIAGSSENNSFVGMMCYDNKLVKVIDLLSLFTTQKIKYDKDIHNIIVLKLEDKDLYFGIVVNGIYDSLEVAKDDFQSFNRSKDDTFIKGLIKPADDKDDKNTMLLVVDVPALYETAF